MAASPSIDQSIALDRFGLGARSGEPAPSDPRAWLTDQIAGRGAARQRKHVSRVPAIDAEFTTLLGSPAARTRESLRAAYRSLRRNVRDLYAAEVTLRLDEALRTEAPFVERLVHFWSNHFAVSADKPQVTLFAADFEQEAIRPFVLGRFEDLLLSVERHPAMQVYLDQSASTGPNSARARRMRADGRAAAADINENRAREILELHTMGVRSGYRQEDVVELALALTGWSLRRPGADDSVFGDFVFKPGQHEPGQRRVLGRRYDPGDEGQAEAILRDLAAAEATARHLAGKLARHFVADDPPAALVDRLARAFLDGGGDLPTVYGALVAAPEAWVARRSKFKSPWDWTVSALRALGRRDVADLDAARLLSELGQPVWRPGSPAGYGDTSADWAGPGALLRRVEAARMFAAEAATDLDARALAAELLPEGAAGSTRIEIARAESNRSGLALFLVSPAFQRR